MSSLGLLARLQHQPAIRRLWSDSKLHLYVYNEIGKAPDSELEVRFNDMAHIERFEQTERWLSRSQFIADCQRRAETDDRYVCTIADKAGPLLGYIMLQVNACDSYFPIVESRVRWPERTATTYGGYVHPSMRGKRLMRILASARDKFVFGQLGMRWQTFAIESTNTSSIQSSSRGPEQIVADLTAKRRFGVVTKSTKRFEPHPEFAFEVE
jgi:GNAT superfamily N-acetyltransferase